MTDNVIPMPARDRTPYVAPLAGHTGVYRVRDRQAPPFTREALVQQARGGWEVLYWFDPASGMHTKRIALPYDLHVDQVAVYAVELVAAAEHVALGWPELLGAAMARSPLVVEIVRAHGPHRDPARGVVCVGDQADEPGAGDMIEWPCRTARILGRLLGVTG